MASISFPTSIGGVNIPGLSSNPLGALFSDPFDVQTVKYPADLGASTRTHYLKFDIYDIDPTTLGAEWKSAFSGLADSVSLENITGGNFFNNFADSFGTFMTSSGLINENTSGMQGFNEKSLTHKRTIALYIPDTVNFDYNAEYGEINLTDVAKSGLAALPGIIGKSANFVLGSDIGKLAMRSAGIALNPNQQVMFDGLKLREFSFEFNFMPKSRKESETVRQIIKDFKYYSRPTTKKDSYGFIFVPPSIFKIRFQFLNRENVWVNKIADSVITNVSVDYGPNGWSTHQDGSPINIKMKLDFKELSLIDRDGNTGVGKNY
jgi:hypothetical protein